MPKKKRESRKTLQRKKRAAMSDSLPSKEARWVSVRECFAVCTDCRQPVLISSLSPTLVAKKRTSGNSDSTGSLTGRVRQSDI